MAPAQLRDAADAEIDALQAEIGPKTDFDEETASERRFSEDMVKERSPKVGVRGRIGISRAP
eukprot:7826672-Prorocentrum_lima.AAC.1